MGEKERIVYTIVTVCVIIAGIITGVWLSHQEGFVLNHIAALYTSRAVDGEAEGKEIPIYFVETNEKKLSISFEIEITTMIQRYTEQVLRCRGVICSVGLI